LREDLPSASSASATAASAAVVGVVEEQEGEHEDVMTKHAGVGFGSDDEVGNAAVAEAGDESGMNQPVRSAGDEGNTASHVFFCIGMFAFGTGSEPCVAPNVCIPSCLTFNHPLIKCPVSR
jgi:hypothetical protein